MATNALKYKYLAVVENYGKMFSRSSFMLLLCLVMMVAFTSGKPQNFTAKPVDEPKSPAAQSLVTNNNYGLANVDLQMIAQIKAKVDYIAAQSRKGVLTRLRTVMASIFCVSLILRIDFWNFDRETILAKIHVTLS